jgi:hypothetical protein
MIGFLITYFGTSSQQQPDSAMVLGGRNSGEPKFASNRINGQMMSFAILR